MYLLMEYFCLLMEYMYMYMSVYNRLIVLCTNMVSPLPCAAAVSPCISPFIFCLFESLCSPPPPPPDFN